MTEVGFVKEVLTLYGPMAMGWVVAGIIGVVFWKAFMGRIAFEDAVFGRVADTLHALKSAVEALRDELTRRRQ